LTSTTLLDSTNCCGICVWKSLSHKNVWEPPKKGSQYYCEARNRSHLTECSKCQCIYSCVGVEDLLDIETHVCHFCRIESSRKAKLLKQQRIKDINTKNKKKGTKEIINESKEVKYRAPHKQCTTCFSRWISEEKTKEREWKCPICVETPEKATTIIKTTVRELVLSNPILLVGLNFKKRFSSILYKTGKFQINSIVTNNKDIVFTLPSTNLCNTLTSTGVPIKMELRGKTCLNDTNELIQILKSSLLKATFEGMY
jgi:hypothetical protein